MLQDHPIARARVSTKFHFPYTLEEFKAGRFVPRRSNVPQVSIETEKEILNVKTDEPNTCPCRSDICICRLRKYFVYLFILLYTVKNHHFVNIT